MLTETYGNSEIGAAHDRLDTKDEVPPQTISPGHPAHAIRLDRAGRPPSALPVLACNPQASCSADPIAIDVVRAAAPSIVDAELCDLDGGAHQTKAVAEDVADDPPLDDTLSMSVIGDIILHHRRYNDLRRAYQRLDLQTQAIKRFAGEGAAVELWCTPYYAAMEPLTAAIKVQEKELAKFAKGLPIHAWAKGIAGLSDRFLALVVGEAGRPISDYRTVAAFWKRMGCAVIDGERQRKVAGDAALLHGYVARRRSLVWNIGESILKQQLRKREDGTRYAIGELGQVYIDRREYEVAKNGEKYSHARAKRYMEKRLLREMWKAWRDAG